MTSRPAAAAGLSTAEIEEIRGGLAAGRKPKVMFTAQAGQIAGQVGQVVELADPATADEWLVVRFGRDELPFSPADLSIPPRGSGGKSAAKPAGSANPSAGGGSVSNGSTNNPVNGSASHGEADRVAPPSPEPRGSDGAEAVDSGSGGRPAKRATKSARAAKPKAPPAMTVTLAYDAGEWTVAASQGNKTLAKPYVIRASEALKMVSLLDVPGVHEAVEQIVSAERAEAQRRADTLRSELAEVEARLAELRDAG